MTYWDTSALLKPDVAGPDSAYVATVAAQEDSLATSTIATSEMLCALYRKENTGGLKSGGAHSTLRRFQRDVDDGRIIAIPYGSDIVTEVEKVVQSALNRRRPAWVRTLDAIHIASALVGGAKMFVATDERLRKVAALVKLKLIP